MRSAYEAEQRRGFCPALWREPVALFYSTFLRRIIFTACGWFLSLFPFPLVLCGGAWERLLDLKLSLWLSRALLCNLVS